MKILVADDESRVVVSLERFFIRRGYVVDVALNGAVALELIEQNNYDFIFLDHNMPELTGVELVKYIKQNNVSAKVVMVTGYPKVDEFFARLIGVDEYLEKPINLEIIDAIIDKYV
jgi:DNA-binding response OmpR family regulator